MIFLTGEKHAGKTGMLLELVREAQARGLHTAGIASPGLWDAQGRRAGFDLLELDTGHRYPLSRRIHGLWPIPYMFDVKKCLQRSEGPVCCQVQRRRPGYCG
ncbi:MAG: nucleoside-triphosphatase [Desulfovermiculus sp.]